MEDANAKILFITPAAKSTGANIFLLRFLRWLKDNSENQFVTLVGYGGDISQDFNDLSKTYEYLDSEDSGDILHKILRKIPFRSVIKRAFLRSAIKREQICLIYSNSVVNHEMLSMFSEWDVPIITHCHEMESVIRFFGNDKFDQTKAMTTHFITVSEAVRKNLIEHYKVPPEKVSLVYGFIPIKEYSEDALKIGKKKVCRELNIPENAFIVGGSGTLEWRKAPEIFIKTAEAVARTNPDAPVYFIWVGGAAEGEFSLYSARFDVEKLGLQDRVFFLEHKPDPLDYFAAIDLFAMVSREDPFPLVCLETASLGKPVVCFENAGGMPEFVGDDCGFTVPYLDIQAMANKIIKLCEDPVLKNDMGKRAAEKVRNDHDILTAAPKILEVIERFLGGKR